jgi:AhpD family alkylhydroperoxidase
LPPDIRLATLHRRCAMAGTVTLRLTHAGGVVDVLSPFGALPAKTKEMLGLVASLGLRCDDCISYHIAECRNAGVTRDEFFEVFSVGLVVRGSRL